MKNLEKIFLVIFILFSPIAKAQEIRGKVWVKYDNKLETAKAAHVTWKGSNTVATTNQNGEFNIEAPHHYPSTLQISYIGFVTKEIVINVPTNEPLIVELTELSTLKSVEIEEKQKSTFSSVDAFGTQIITEKELKKAACCNLSESFETNATVDVSYSDAVTGIKKITLLGLEGKYVFLSTELLPSFRGLNQTYGLSFIPGTWIESIQVSKGAGSVVYGYESITGQINVEIKKPEKEEPLFVNIFANQMARTELNVHYAHQFSEKWSTLTLFHADYFRLENDRNEDGFLDLPFHRQINLMHRWKFEVDKVESMFGVKYLNDFREGGQLGFYSPITIGIPFYGYSSNTDRVEGFAKTGFFFEGKPYKSIGTMVKLVGHRQQMKFGQRNYTGNQNMLHTNFIYQSILGNTNRTFKTGVSYYLDDYNETFLDTNLLRTESVPGVFGEYTHNFVPEKYIVVAGIRYDNHNLFGHFVSPRIHSKLDVNNVGVFRFSAGRGYRVSNILTENASLLVSSRVVNIQEALQPEVGWTYGASFKKDMTILKKDVDLNIDFFRTDFENQIVVDMETPGKLLFYNLQGNSFSNVAQADLEIEWIKNLSTRFSYKWQEVKTTYRGVLEDVPFVPTHRGMINIAYETPNEKWVFDLTSQIIGQSRLPFIFNPITQQANPLQSPTYSLYNAQVTYKAKKIEYYIGAENLLDYRQANPIVNPGQPFSESFDASQIWAPIFGRMIYGGLRFTLAKK